MSTEIAVIQKNRDDELRVALKEYEGHPYVDVRTFTEYQSGEVGPTKKGVTIGVSKLCQLIEASTPVSPR